MAYLPYSKLVFYFSFLSNFSSENDKNAEEEDEETDETPQELFVEKLSLAEGIKDAHIDHSRIIHPKNSLSAATLYEFVPATRIKGLDDWICESQHYEYYKKSLDFPINIEDETFLPFPDSLNVYTYEKCNVSSFPHPELGPTGVLSMIVYFHFLFCNCRWQPRFNKYSHFRLLLARWCIDSTCISFKFTEG